ncbi:MAG: N(4)-(beta-N-acetylglucosaminyl)-L-asparaginase [Thermomicrobiales bacterium]|nr:N(4)-(beta-N-acetylglucosaminyl)-L-asparaginase [Thermomicrobiales bacterium]
MTGLLVGSANARIGLRDGIAVLAGGGSALNAVVAVIRRVEANPDDHSVGFGGLPNLLGDVELDASIMDGRTLATGAVAGLRGYQDAIDLARVVMTELPHVLIVGEGAARLASESGFQLRDLLTPEARQIWASRIENAQPTDLYTAKTRELAARLTRDPERPHDAHGTVNVIARDGAGNIASGVSTSGWAWKFPGRAGDSPIIGAGNYADQRYGAATCTGRGEMAQRCCTAHSVVTFMRFGMPLDDALRLAAEDLHRLDDPYKSEVNIVAIDREGRHAGASTVPGKTYIVMTTEMDEPLELERRYIPPAPDRLANQ